VPPLSTAENRKMEVEEYQGRSRLYRRLRSGPHGQLVERYAARLVEERLVRHGTWRCLYNPKRRHSTIGYLSPMEFERRAGLA